MTIWNSEYNVVKSTACIMYKNVCSAIVDELFKINVKFPEEMI